MSVALRCHEGYNHHLCRSCALVLLVGTLALLTSACGVDVIGDDPPLDRMFDPVGLALHPDGQRLYVVNSNFDLSYRADRGGTVTVLDTEQMRVIPEGTVQIGSFGGEIVLTPDGERAYVAVRGNRSATALDIDDDGDKISCRGSTQSTACQIVTSNDDPFGLSLQTSQRGDLSIDIIAVTHLVGGNVTGLARRFNPDGGGSCSTGSIDACITRVSAPIVAGANDVELSPRTGQFYTTSRFTNSVVAFRPVLDTNGELEGIFETGEVRVENANPVGGIDSRGIAFNREGTMAYIANRGPNALVFVDVGPTDLLAGSGTRNRVVDQIIMPASPADVVTANIDGRELVYVAAFEQNEIWVVDPEIRAVIDTIEISASPYNMLVDNVHKKRLYTTLFSQAAVAVIDLDPASASFNKVIGVIQ